MDDTGDTPPDTASSSSDSSGSVVEFKISKQLIQQKAMVYFAMTQEDDLGSTQPSQSDSESPSSDDDKKLAAAPTTEPKAKSVKINEERNELRVYHPTPPSQLSQHCSQLSQHCSQLSQDEEDGAAKALLEMKAKEKNRVVQEQQKLMPAPVVPAPVVPAAQRMPPPVVPAAGMPIPKAPSNDANDAVKPHPTKVAHRQKMIKLFGSKKSKEIAAPHLRRKMLDNVRCNRNRSTVAMIDPDLVDSRQDLVQDAEWLDEYMDRNPTRIHEKWKGAQLGKMLTVVYDILEANKGLPKKKATRSKKKGDKSKDWITNFGRFFDNCERLIAEEDVKEREKATNETKVPGARKINVTPPKVETINGLKVIQFKLARENGDWPEKRSKETCPLCGHGNLIEAMDGMVIGEKTREMEKKYLASKEAIGNGKKGDKAKPETPKYPEVYFACMCVVSRATNIADGSGCNVCETTYEKSGRIFYDYEAGKSTCGVCNCPCDAYYKHRLHQALTAKMDLKRSMERAEAEAAKKKEAKEAAEEERKKKEKDSESFLFFHDHPCVLIPRVRVLINLILQS